MQKYIRRQQRSEGQRGEKTYDTFAEVAVVFCLRVDLWRNSTQFIRLACRGNKYADNIVKLKFEPSAFEMGVGIMFDGLVCIKLATLQVY